MKKYNLSKIMKRAWELIKKLALTISEGLKQAWREAKMEMKIKELVEKYKMFLSSDGTRLGVREMEQAKTDGMMDTIKAQKDDIMSFLKEKKAAEEKAAKERIEKINAIEGLKEIQEAIQEQETWTRKFNYNMNNEYTSSIVSSRPEDRVETLKEKYPRAAAYLKAESLFLSENSDISNIGKSALDKIINGEDFVSVMKKVEEERKSLAESHMWD